MAPGGVIQASFTGCAGAGPAGRVHRSARVYRSQRQFGWRVGWRRPELAAMGGWVAHADPKTDRRSIPGGWIAHAHTEALGFKRTVGLRFLLQILAVVCVS